MSKLRDGSQNSLLLADLMRGRKITAYDALADYGCMRLAARVAELRASGHAIETQEYVTSTGKTIALYYIRKANR